MTPPEPHPLGFAIAEATNNGNGGYSWRVQGGNYVARAEYLAPTPTDDPVYQSGSWDGVHLYLRSAEGSDEDIYLRFILRDA